MNELKIYRVKFNDQYGKYQIEPSGICGYEEQLVVTKEDYDQLSLLNEDLADQLTHEMNKRCGFESECEILRQRIKILENKA